jgi:hypothetical protein
MKVTIPNRHFCVAPKKVVRLGDSQLKQRVIDQSGCTRANREGKVYPDDRNWDIRLGR